MRKMDWHHERAGAGYLAEKSPSGSRRLIAVPVKNR
jgi:hypothetical protein